MNSRGFFTLHKFHSWGVFLVFWHSLCACIVLNNIGLLVLHWKSPLSVHVMMYTWPTCYIAHIMRCFTCSFSGVQDWCKSGHISRQSKYCIAVLLPLTTELMTMHLETSSSADQSAPFARHRCSRDCAGQSQPDGHWVLGPLEHPCCTHKSVSLLKCPVSHLSLLSLPLPNTSLSHPRQDNTPA